MEIAILSKGTLRVKGKTGSIVIDPDEKEKSGTNGVILLTQPPQASDSQDEIVLVNGPGDYEIAGIKMVGTKNESDTIYTIKVDGVEILLGRLSAMDKMQHKLKDHNIVLVNCNTQVSASFLTSSAANMLMLYGEKAEEIAQSFGKENIKQMNKYASTLEKLPSEVETIVLA